MELAGAEATPFTQATMNGHADSGAVMDDPDEDVNAPRRRSQRPGRTTRATCSAAASTRHRRLEIRARTRSPKETSRSAPPPSTPSCRALELACRAPVVSCCYSPRTRVASVLTGCVHHLHAFPCRQ